MSDDERRAAAASRVRSELSLVSQLVESVLDDPTGWIVCVNDVELACDDLRRYLVNYVKIATREKTEEQP